MKIAQLCLHFEKKIENADNAFVLGCDSICHLSSGSDVTHLGLELKKKKKKPHR